MNDGKNVFKTEGQPESEARQVGLQANELASILSGHDAAVVKTSVPGYEHAIVTGAYLRDGVAYIQTYPKGKRDEVSDKLARIAAIVDRAGYGADNTVEPDFKESDLESIYAIATGTESD